MGMFDVSSEDQSGGQTAPADEASPTAPDPSAFAPTGDRLAHPQLPL
jgi:hypothetical protein